MGGPMSSRAEHAISRRSALTGFVIAAACGSTTAGRVFSSRASENDLGPGFSPSGPNAEYYGEKEGFPVADHSLSVQPGEPYDIKYRVGAYTHFDEIYPTHRIKRAARPWMFKRSKADIRYSFRGNRSCCRVSIAESSDRFADCEGRRNTFRALPVWADRPGPVHVAIYGEVGHSDAGWHRYRPRRDQ